MSLGDKVKNTLKDVLEPMVDLMLVPVKLAIEFGLEGILDILGERFAPVMKPFIDTLESTGKVPPELQPMLDEMKEPKGEVASLMSFSMARGGLGAVSGGIGTTITASLDQAVKALLQPSLLDIESIIQVERRIKDSKQFTDQEWLWSGFNTQRRELLREITRPLIGLQQIQFIYNRFPDRVEYIDNALREYGFKDSDITYIKMSFKQYPGTQDLITMAVREAFSPDVISKFGLSDDFPEEFAKEAEKQGLPREWAERYWMSHWRLPSTNQGFEMLHRGVIDQSEMDLLLRTADIMPYWRDRLTKIAYAPLTRVDVRRMHAEGVINRDDVLRAYQDLGYDDINAERLTEFTVKYNQSAERDLTKTEILDLYKDGNLESNEALELMIELGYDEDTAAELLGNAAASAAAKTRDLTLSQVKNLFLSGGITQAEATSRLAKIGYVVSDIEKLYDLWEAEAEPTVRLPSRTDLEAFWKKEIIDDDTWYDYMLLLGYQEDIIVWYYLEMSE